MTRFADDPWAEEPPAGGATVLVTRRSGRLVLVTQPDHGALAGRLAAGWGNQRFATPRAHDALLSAATHHDDGWLELDRAPAYNPAKRRPAHFIELALSETAGPYARNVESLYERDLRTGALVGMHLSGFYTGRWGLQSGGPANSALAMEVVAAQEARWMPALREAWAYLGPRSAFDADIWFAYEVLQALDLISLALGLLDLERASDDAPALSMTDSLRSIEQPVAARIVPGVPETPGGARVDLELRVAAPGRVMLDPYPFAEPEFEVTLPARWLEDRAYDSAQDAASAFHAAPVGALCAVLAAPPAG